MDERALFERLCEPTSAHLLTQEAICDSERCAELSSLAQAWLDTEEPLQRALSLHLIRALGLRAVALSIPVRLSEGWMKVKNPLWGRPVERVTPVVDVVSFFAQPIAYYAQQTLAETALRALFTLSPHAHPARTAGLNWGLEALRYEPRLISALWEAWPAERSLLPLAEHLGALLTLSPSVGEALAVRLALLHLDEALPICEALSGLSEQSLTPLREALHKQLLRVKRVRLWVSCREALR